MIIIKYKDRLHGTVTFKLHIIIRVECAQCKQITSDNLYGSEVDGHLQDLIL